jgi:hypothetical protein
MSASYEHKEKFRKSIDLEQGRFKTDPVSTE